MENTTKNVNTWIGEKEELLVRNYFRMKLGRDPSRTEVEEFANSITSYLETILRFEWRAHGNK